MSTRDEAPAEDTRALPHFLLNGPDVTMLNSSAVVSVLFGERMPAPEQSPFRTRMPRLWELAGIPYEVIQKGSAQVAHRGRTDFAITVADAQRTYDFAMDHGLYVPAKLYAVTRQRDPMPLPAPDPRRQELEKENTLLRERLAEAGIAV